MPVFNVKLDIIYQLIIFALCKQIVIILKTINVLDVLMDSILILKKKSAKIVFSKVVYVQILKIVYLVWIIIILQVPNV